MPDTNQSERSERLTKTRDPDEFATEVEKELRRLFAAGASSRDIGDFAIGAVRHLRKLYHKRGLLLSRRVS